MRTSDFGEIKSHMGSVIDMELLSCYKLSI